jgi:hypothetical protein
MAFSVTSRISENDGESSGTSHVTASFTPTASSRLFVFAGAERDNSTAARSWSITDSLGGTGWTLLDTSTLVDWVTSDTYAGNCVAWYKDIGGSPSAMTVTVDGEASDSAFYSVIVFDVTGYDTGAAFPQASVDNGASVDPVSDSASGTLTLGSSPTNGNLVVGMFWSSADDGGGFATPSGYSVLSNQSGTSQFQQAGVFYRTDTTTAAIACTDLGQQVGNWGGIAFEMTLGGGGGGGRTTRNTRNFPLGEAAGMGFMIH